MPQLFITKGDTKMVEDINKLLLNSNLKGSESEKLALVDSLEDYFLSRLNRLEYELAYQVELVDLNNSFDASSPQNTKAITQPSLFIDREAFNGLFSNISKIDREKLIHTLQG